MSRYTLSKSVVMVGMMGAGKTSVGTALATLVGAEFLDSDHEIEIAANMTVAEIFNRDGEVFFREKEAQVLARLMAGPACILSIGGGAFLRAQNRTIIEQHGLSVWLKVAPELLWARVRHKDTRPLLQVDDPHKALMDLYKIRVPAYQQAGLTVASDEDLSVADMAAKVAEALLAQAEPVLRKVA